MNNWRGQLKYLFVDAGFHCAMNRHGDFRWAIKLFFSFAPTTGLDKIFYRGPLRLMHAGDHPPIIGGFEISGADVTNAIPSPATPKESRTR